MMNYKGVRRILRRALEAGLIDYHSPVGALRDSSWNPTQVMLVIKSLLSVNKRFDFLEAMELNTLDLIGKKVTNKFNRKGVIKRVGVEDTDYVFVQWGSSKFSTATLLSEVTVQDD